MNNFQKLEMEFELLKNLVKGKKLTLAEEMYCQHLYAEMKKLTTHFIEKRKDGSLYRGA